MNIASPNSTTTATMTSVVATTGSSVSGTTVSSSSSSSSGSSSGSSGSIKRWTVAKSHAAASYLHFTRPLSSSSLAGTSPPPPPPPSKGQHFHDQVINSKRGQGGHQHHHHLVGSKILSSSSLVVSENSNIGTVCRSSCWQESDFAIDGLLGEGHFGKIYRAYCYPRSLTTGATTTTTTTTTTTSRTGRATDGLPRALGITVSTLPNHANHPNDAATTDKTTTCSTATTSTTINIPKNNNTVALKRFSKDRIADAKQRGSRLTELLQREINIHSNLQHPCIISFLGHYVDHHHLTLVLEYAPFGDLYGYMAMMEQQHQAEGGMSLDMRLETARTVMSQMTAAVAHLQRLFVAHRDIKSENVLLVEAVPAACHSATIGKPRQPLPVPTVFKLCDFGWAVSYQGFISGRLSTLCGTPEYVPPEMLGGPNRFYRGEFVDPWALGVLAYELVVGDTPFYVDDKNENCHYASTDTTIGGGSSHGQQDVAMDTSNNTTTSSSSLRKKKNTVDRIFDNIRNFRELELPFEEAVDEDYIDLVQGFLQAEPMHRRLAGDCLNHAFFQQGSYPSNQHCGDGNSSAVGQKENIMEKTYHHDSTAPAPTVAQRCELWNKQKTFGLWP